jgi:hypothetical protein
MPEFRDILANHKICSLRVPASQGISAAAQLKIDLMEASDVPGIYERTSKGLILIEVSSLGAGAKLNLLVKDSPDDVTYDDDFVTIEEIDATGLYAIPVDGINRYFYLYSTVTVDAVVWGAAFIGFEAQRRPVKQSDATELTVTYGDGRLG